MTAAYALWHREVTRFFRQRHRVVGALATPLVFWLFLGSGFGGSFKGDSSYIAYLFPGVLTMILLFSAIFSTISIIEDRREGFLQGVLIAPVSRGTIVFGKVAGGATIALIHAAVLLALGPLAGIPLTWPGIGGALCVMAILAFGLTSLGAALAWRLDSVQGYHAIMNLLLMPMWLLSGAVFPATGSAAWLKPVMAVNPLTHGVAALRGCLSGDPATFPIIVSAAAAFAMFALATWTARRRDPRGGA